MSNELTVKVIGKCYSGKSTVCAIIEDALREHGFLVDVHLLDGDRVSNISERVDHLVNKLETKITIEECTCVSKHTRLVD